MITIVYAPNCQCVSDFDVHAECRALQMAIIRGEDDAHYGYSTENVIQELLTWIAEEKINIDDIQFMFNDKVLDVNCYGRVTNWPTGFADNTWNINQRRLMAQAARRKKEREWLQKS